MAKATEKNTYFDDKPEWFRGYAMTIAQFLVDGDRTVDGSFMTKPSDIAVHMTDCSIAEVWDVDEESSMEHSYDTFGDGAYATVFVSVSFSCACGKYHRERLSINSTLSDVISSALWTRK